MSISAPDGNMYHRAPGTSNGWKKIREVEASLKTCKHCGERIVWREGTSVQDGSRWAEWHTTERTAQEHYLNVCHGHAQGHEPAL